MLVSGIGFFMRLSRALALTHDVASTALDGLGALLDPELVKSAFESAGVATVRKRRLPLEAMIWCVIGMALFRRMSAWDVVSRMDVMLPGQRPLVAPSAVVQGRQRLGSEAVREVFTLTQQRWHAAVNHPSWAGLRLFSVDGVVWRPIRWRTVSATAVPATRMATPAFPRSAWCVRWS